MKRGPRRSLRARPDSGCGHPPNYQLRARVYRESPARSAIMRGGRGFLIHPDATSREAPRLRGVCPYAPLFWPASRRAAS
jgi:hypothetical protein